LKMKGTVILEFIKGSNDRTCMIWEANYLMPLLSTIFNLHDTFSYVELIHTQISHCSSHTSTRSHFLQNRTLLLLDPDCLCKLFCHLILFLCSWWVVDVMNVIAARDALIKYYKLGVFNTQLNKIALFYHRYVG
jgi:hypothetical protein